MAEKKTESEKGYIMIYAKELKMMHKVLAPEQVARVLYNIGNVAIREHGGEPPEDMEMSDIEYIAYKTIKERIKGNLANAAKRKPGGAPEGNTNAQAKNKEVKIAKIKALADLGLKPAQIATELSDVSESTVRRYLKEIDYFPSNKHRDLSNKHRDVSVKHNYNNNNSGCMTDLAGEARHKSTAEHGDQSNFDNPTVASGSEISPANGEEVSAMLDTLYDKLAQKH